MYQSLQKKMASLWLMLLLYAVAPAAGTSSPRIRDRPACQRDRVDTPATRIDMADRLLRFREQMEMLGVHAHIFTAQDEHGVEKEPGYDKQLCYISGLCTMTAKGVAVVTRDKAVFWTRDRYIDETERHLDCHWSIAQTDEEELSDEMFYENAATPTLTIAIPSIAEWLGHELAEGNVVSVNPKLISIHDFERLSEALVTENIELREIESIMSGETPRDLDTEAGSEETDDVFARERRDTSFEGRPVVIYDIKFAGKSWEDKIEDLLGTLQKAHANATVMSTLEEIAWLFNLRGSDTAKTPTFFSMSIVARGNIRLYLKNIAKQLASESLRKHLNVNEKGRCDGQTGHCVELHDYDGFYAGLPTALDKLGKVWISPRSNHVIKNSVPQDRKLIKFSPVILMMMVKNDVEQAGMRAANVRDAVAFIQTVASIEKQVKDGERLTELDAVKMAVDNMKRQQYNKDFSSANTASARNSGNPFYSNSNKTNLPITMTDTFVQSSLGQYLDGTTDTKRSYLFGTPTAFQKEAYTRILMSFIDMATLKWRKKHSYGRTIEAFGRRPLWEVGLSFTHILGYGIGHYLGGIEGPLRLASGCYYPKKFQIDPQIKPGMFFVIGPATYRYPKWGMSLDSVMMVKKVKLKADDEEFYEFTPVVFVPFEPHLIDVELLSPQQLSWLNDYHSQVETVVGGELKKQGLNDEFEWMKARTGKLYKKGDMGATTMRPPTTVGDGTTVKARLATVAAMLVILAHL